MASSTASAVPEPSASNMTTPAGQKASDDLWGAALELLQPDDKERIRLRSEDKVTVLSEVLAGALEKREQCKDRQWKLKRINGKVIVLRDVFDKMVSWLNKLQNIGDFVAQLDPVHLAFPWSVIKFFLQVE